MPRRVWMADWIANSDRRATCQRSAIVHVFAFGVLPYDYQVDRLVAAQRAEHAAEGLGRANVGVKIERLT